MKRWRSPEWLLEGMAYELSDDPRTPLAEPFEQYRARFRAWYEITGAANMWPAARKF